MAKKIKTNHELALELWDTGNIDARFLAILVIEPKSLDTVPPGQLRNPPQGHCGGLP